MAREHANIEAYSIHGRDGDELLDYDGFFEELVGLDPVARQVEIFGDQVVALSSASRNRGLYVLRFVAGTKGEIPIYYDLDTGEETQADIGNAILASASWAVVDTRRRLLVLEKKRPGVAVAKLERALESFAERLGFRDFVRIDLNAVMAPSFLDEVDRLERIREASIVLQRPNSDWADNAARITDYSDESDGDRVELKVTAGRGRALARTRGIIADIYSLVTDPMSAVKDVVVSGFRPDDTIERTVRQAKHRERMRVPIDEAGSGRDPIVSGARQLMDRIDVDTSEPGEV